MNLLLGILRNVHPPSLPHHQLLHRTHALLLPTTGSCCLPVSGQTTIYRFSVSLCQRHHHLLALNPSRSIQPLNRCPSQYLYLSNSNYLKTLGYLGEIPSSTRDLLSQYGAVLQQRWLHSSPSCCRSDQLPPNSPLIKTTEFDKRGRHITKIVSRSELLASHTLQPRDIRFSAASSLYIRGSAIILKLQHIKAILNPDSLLLLDSDHPAIRQFIPELQEKLAAVVDDPLPFELRVLDALLQKMFLVLDERLSQLQPALRDVLNSLLDPRVFSVDRGELHILLLHSRSLSEFHSLVKDIEVTLVEVLDSEEDMAEMYLTHWATTGIIRDEDDIEDVYNILESYALQAENIQSEIQKLRELINQSESIILINLDSQRNVMLRLSLQLEMGMFAAAFAGLIGMAFGMNLDSSLEENSYAFWVVTGMMILICGTLWRRLLLFTGKNLDHVSIKRLPKKLNSK